jgi:hypothetical protein
MLSIKRAVSFFIIIYLSVTVYGETLSGIMANHDEKIAKAKKNYDARVKKTVHYTIKRLEQLKKETTRAGKLEEAIEIQNQINKLQGKAPMAVEEDDITGGIPAPPEEDTESFSERKAKKNLKKRYVEFHEALIENKFEKAMEYLDPEIRKGANEQMLQGHLRIIAGFLQAAQIKNGGIGIERVKFTDKLKEAKITGKLRSPFSGRWEESKDPSYWIFRHGEWFLGNDKILQKLF